MRHLVREWRWLESAAWDNYFESCPYATYFHSRRWAEAWSHGSAGKVVPRAIGLVLSNGLHVAIPLVRTGPPGMRRFASSAGGTYGGWLAEAPLSDADASEVFAFAAEKFGNIRIRLNPYQGNISAPSIGTFEADTTQAVDLRPGLEAIRSTWSHGHLASIRKAEANGIRVVLGSTETDWRAYFELYQDSLRRWGSSATSSYRWELFDALRRSPSENVKLWLAIHQGAIVSGQICVSSGLRTIYWHGSTLESSLRLSPATLLIQEVIKRSISSGHSWFDFNPSGGHTGVVAFKRNFGTVALPAATWAFRSAGRRTIAAILGSLRR